MAGLFDRQAEAYADVRPTYPSEWYSKIAALTSNRTLAWDVGTGNGQAATGIAEHFERVIATDVSEAQLKHAIPHPKVRYVHTPVSMSKEELASLVGGEGSVDLIIVAEAVHWFDHPTFYSIVNHVLKKPGGIIAVWGYKTCTVDPPVDRFMRRFRESTIPFVHPNNSRYLSEFYLTLPFPFESVGVGSEGNPLMLDLPQELSSGGFVKWLSTWSAVPAAKERGVDLLNEDVVKELQSAWGDSDLTKTVIHKAFMIAGKPRTECIL